MSIAVEAIFVNDAWHTPVYGEIHEDPHHPLGEGWYSWKEEDEEGLDVEYGARASVITVMRYSTRES